MRAAALVWGDIGGAQRLLSSLSAAPDVLLCADLVYRTERAEPLAATLEALSGPDTRVLVCQDRHSDEAWAAFLAAVRSGGQGPSRPESDRQDAKLGSCCPGRSWGGARVPCSAPVSAPCSSPLRDKLICRPMRAIFLRHLNPFARTPSESAVPTHSPACMGHAHSSAWISESASALLPPALRSPDLAVVCLRRRPLAPRQAPEARPAPPQYLHRGGGTHAREARPTLRLRNPKAPCQTRPYNFRLPAPLAPAIPFRVPRPRSFLSVCLGPAGWPATRASFLRLGPLPATRLDRLSLHVPIPIPCFPTASLALSSHSFTRRPVRSAPSPPSSTPLSAHLLPSLHHSTFSAPFPVSALSRCRRPYLAHMGCRAPAQRVGALHDD